MEEVVQRRKKLHNESCINIIFDYINEHELDRICRRQKLDMKFEWNFSGKTYR